MTPKICLFLVKLHSCQPKCYESYEGLGKGGGGGSFAWLFSLVRFSVCTFVSLVCLLDLFVCLFS